MSNPYNNDEPHIPAGESDDYLTASSIIDWIIKVDTSTPTSSSSSSSQLPVSSQSRELSPTLRAKRRRRDSLPSVFYGGRPSLRKRSKVSRAMAGNVSPPSTPSVKNTSTTSGGPSTPSPGTFLESLKPGKNVKAVGRFMEDNGLYKDDRAAFDSYPDFKARVQAILATERGSAMKPKSHKKFQNYLDWYELSNESTFLRKIFPLLMKDGSHLTKDNGFPDEVASRSKTAEYSEYRDFMEELGVVDTSDREFLSTLVPSTCNPENEKAIAKLLAKVAHMKNPKPDYTFGLRYDMFPSITDVPVPEYIQALLSIAPELTHAFLIVEGKPHAGSQAEAEHQVRRGGATLVHAEQLLRERVEGAGASDALGLDEKSFVFSVTFTPKMAEFWVHWYESKGPGKPGKYHMNGVGSRLLQDEDMRADIRSRLHNIMEWGGTGGARFQDLLTLHESIHDFARREQAHTSPRKKRKFASSSKAESSSVQEGEDEF